MSNITHGEAIELLIAAVPYPEQIKSIEIKEDAVYFNWRSSRYKMETYNGSIMRSNGALLEGNDCSILMSELVKRVWYNKLK